MLNEEIISNLKDFVANGENYSAKKIGGNQNIGLVSAMKFEKVTRIFAYETEIAAADSNLPKYSQQIFFLTKIIFK